MDRALPAQCSPCWVSPHHRTCNPAAAPSLSCGNTVAQSNSLLFGASDEATGTWCIEAAASDAAILANRAGILAQSRGSPRRLAADDHAFGRHRGAARDPIRAHGMEPVGIRRAGEARRTR